jgi:glycosyltransferase involved in cell wall biosynthesis
MFEKRMKVALIHIRYIYKGGLETRLFNYINYFLERGDEVHLYTSKISPDITPPENLHIHLVNLKHVLKPVRNFFFDKKLKHILERNAFDFILSLERTSRQYHVIAPSTHKGYLVAKKSRFYDLVDLIQIYLDRKAFGSAKVVFACSNMIKEEIVSYYNIPPEQIKVLYPPVNLSKFTINLTKQEAQDKYQLDGKNTYFLFVSTSHKRKGLDLLLEVFAKLPTNYKLLVAGTPFERDLDNVISLGFVKEMNDLYRASDFLLHPAIYEPFGQIISEAFASHLPVIVSSKVGAKELITDKNGVVVNSLLKEDWIKAIELLSTRSFDFHNIDELLNELSLEKHMENMLNWAILRN